MNKNVVIVIVLILAAVGVWFFFFRKKPDNGAAKAATTQATASKAAVKYPNIADLGLFDNGEATYVDGVKFIKSNDSWQLAE